MQADRTNPMLIQVSSENAVIGHMTTKEFREYMRRPSRFLPDLILDFNAMKERRGEPERVKTVLNAV